MNFTDSPNFALVREASSKDIFRRSNTEMKNTSSLMHCSLFYSKPGSNSSESCSVSHFYDKALSTRHDGGANSSILSLFCLLGFVVVVVLVERRSKLHLILLLFFFMH